jgi:hypothetical protein
LQVELKEIAMYQLHSIQLLKCSHRIGLARMGVIPSPKWRA